MMSALWTHLVKDLRIEWRSKEAINSMLFFALLVVVLFSLAFDPRGAFSQTIAGGVLTVAIMFASVSALNQAWAREIRHQVLDAQRMAPTPGAELFLAKVIANFLFVTMVQIVLAPVFVVLYNLHIVGQAWQLALVLPLGTWALVAQWDVFCGALDQQPQPRAAAAADPVSDLHAGSAGDGASDGIDFYGRQRPGVVDQAAAGLRHHFHYGEPAAVRRGAARRVRKPL